MRTTALRHDVRTGAVCADAHFWEQNRWPFWRPARLTTVAPQRMHVHWYAGLRRLASRHAFEQKRDGLLALSARYVFPHVSQMRVLLTRLSASRQRNEQKRLPCARSDGFMVMSAPHVSQLY
jgi:hypothetical protein